MFQQILYKHLKEYIYIYFIKFLHKIFSLYIHEKINFIMFISFSSRNVHNIFFFSISCMIFVFKKSIKSP